MLYYIMRLLIWQLISLLVLQISFGAFIPRLKRVGLSFCRQICATRLIELAFIETSTVEAIRVYFSSYYHMLPRTESSQRHTYKAAS
jgi:hypothetical protein